MKNTKEEQTYSVPSSILLCGEYIITEENGVGICLGVEPRSYLHIKKRKVTQSEVSLKIICKYASQTITFLQANDFDFWAIALELAPNIYCNAYKSDKKLQYSLNDILYNTTQYYAIELHIDTSHLYNKETKQKLGLGSSASCAILTCAAYMLLCHYDPEKNLDILLYFATQVHYQWQQKQGSGYEFYASIYGGAILLQHQNQNTNSKKQAIEYTHEYTQKKFTYTKIPFPTQFSWVYWNSNHSISSRKALYKYMQWKQKYPTQQQELMKKMLNTINAYGRCTSYNDYCTWLTTMQNLGISLGKAIGQSADISLPMVKTDYSIHTIIKAYKACGAGNEQGIGLLTNTNKKTYINRIEQMYTLSISQGFRQEHS